MDEEGGGEKSKVTVSRLSSLSSKKAKRSHGDTPSSGAEEAILLIQSDDEKDDEDVLKSIDQTIAKKSKSKSTPRVSNGKKDSSKLSPNTISAKNGHQKPRKRKDEVEESGDAKKKNGFCKVKVESEVIVVEKYVDVAAASSSKAQRQVCCVCLNKQSDGYNELVECDSCGFMVHEGCYGITDTDSKLSTHSEASTEPWFCNSCLLDDARLLDHRLNAADPTPFLNRSCELCPNTRCGLMKETDSGKFVHIVCALYTPGIAYYDTDILWPVVLDEIPAQSWGAQACSLCDNPQLSRTGVCIKCDAGLCRSYFHVTCAQKHGYLCDPTLQNENDPFIAYCKLHNDKPVISSRKTNHKLMLANLEEKWLNNTSRQFEHSDDKTRLSVKYQTARDNYQIKRQKHMRKPSTVKIPRMLTTCPSALKMLLAKTSLKGSSSLADEIETNALSRRNLGYHPTFTVEFLKYYLDREKKMPDYYKELHELKRKQEQLTAEEETLRHRLDALSAESVKTASADLNKSQELLSMYVKLCETICPEVKEFSKSPAKTVYSLLAESNNSNDKPASETPPASKKSNKLKSVTSNTSVKSDQRRKSQNDSKPRSSKSVGRPPSSSTKSSKENSVPPVTPSPPERTAEQINLNACCSVCSKKTNSHLLIDCDSCKKYYHISCLNPPLSHMPKKTKLYGWECSFCALKKDSDYEAADSDEMDEILSKNSKSFTVFKRPKIDLEGCRQLRRERNKKVIFDS